jgi:hypothetical protein
VVIGKQFPGIGGTARDELLVVLHEEEPLRPFLGTRGELEWEYTVRNLRPFTRHRVRLHLRTEMVRVTRTPYGAISLKTSE